MANRTISLMRPSQMFDVMMDEMMNLPRLRWNDSGSTADVYEDENNYYIEVSAAGFKKEEIEITLENGFLTVKAERSEESKKKHDGKKIHMQESYRESFVKSVSLPGSVNSDNVQAVMEDGILKITLPKKEEDKSRKITIGD